MSNLRSTTLKSVTLVFLSHLAAFEIPPEMSVHFDWIQVLLNIYSKACGKMLADKPDGRKEVCSGLGSLCTSE